MRRLLRLFAIALVAFVNVSVSDKKDGYDPSVWSVSMRGDEPPRRPSPPTRTPYHPEKRK